MIFRKLICFIFLFIITVNVKAEIIREVIIRGNGKTEEAYILRHGDFKIGDDISPEMLQEISEKLRRINQINIDEIDFKNGILSIKMKDKWTLFPIPMITQSGNYYSRGILLYDNNFLGTLGTFAPAVAWTNSGFNGLLYFQDETFFNPTTGFKIILLRKSDLSEFERQGNIVTSFESKNDTAAFAPNILFGKHVFKGGPLYFKKKISSDNNSLNGKEEGTGLMFRHHYNDYETLEISFKGLVTTYNLIAYHGNDGSYKFLNEADLLWNYPVYRNDIFNLKFHGIYINSKNIMHAKTIGGHEGYRGYDKLSIPVSKNIGGMIQYQKNIWTNLYLAPFYEFNAIQLANNINSVNNLNESTVGVSLYYYFKKISIPAVMIDFARNLDDESIHVLFNIGVSI